MAYPLAAPITMDSKADKLSVVMAKDIVISFFAWEPPLRSMKEANYLV